MLGAERRQKLIVVAKFRGASGTTGLFGSVCESTWTAALPLERRERLPPAMFCLWSRSMANKPPMPRCKRCRQEIEDEDRQPCRSCKTDPFPGDTWLRRQGWKILARPRHGADLWARDGLVMATDEALGLEQVRCHGATAGVAGGSR